MGSETLCLSSITHTHIHTVIKIKIFTPFHMDNHLRRGPQIKRNFSVFSTRYVRIWEFPHHPKLFHRKKINIFKYFYKFHAKKLSRNVGQLKKTRKAWMTSRSNERTERKCWNVGRIKISWYRKHLR